MYNKFLILLLLLLGYSHIYSQSDSLKVSQLLDSILLQADRKEYFQNKIDKLELKNLNNDDVISDIWLLKIKHKIRQGNIEGADEINNKALSRFKDNPVLFASFQNVEGSLHALRRQFNEAITSFQKALKTYDSLGMNKRSAYLKNNIANIFFNLNDFETAYPYALEAFEEVYHLNDTIHFPQFAAVLAISEAKTNKREDAKAHAQLAITSGEKFNNPLAIIIGKYALGDYYALGLEWEEAQDYYESVVSTSKTYGLLQYEMYGRIGLITTYIALKNYNEAIHQGERVIEINDKLSLHFSDYTIYQQLSEAYNAIGNHEKAYIYLDKANTLYREYSSIETKKNIQELLIKYEAKEKENELALKQLKLARSSNWILILGLMLFLLIGFALWWRKRNYNKLLKLRVELTQKQQEAYVEGEQRERERIASDIHDGIASTLTGLALKIQQVKDLDEIPMFYEHINSVRNEVRMVSKNIQPFNIKTEGWTKSFQHFLDIIKSDKLMVFLITEFDEEHFNNQRGIVVYRIIQELIQNTIKHAEASECEIIITEGRKNILIQYSDNGKGVNKEKLEKGNGWQSILKRIDAIRGKIKLPENPLTGLKIDIQVPKSLKI